MDRADLDAWLSRSRALDLGAIPWEEVARHPVSPDALRALRYMQDIESHTVIYLRSLLATRSVDEPAIAAFLACWFYEETFHGLALARFLEAAGQPVGARARARGDEPFVSRLLSLGTAVVSRCWPDFVSVHMAWGAINELTTLSAYVRLSKLARHPVLAALLQRIVQDESRHFLFYYRQAEARLRRPGAARIARLLIERFWAPVGSREQPHEETRFLAGYLFSGDEGREAARRLDATIGRLPGFDGIPLVEAWLERHAPAPPGGPPARAASR